MMLFRSTSRSSSKSKSPSPPSSPKSSHRRSTSDSSTRGRTLSMYNIANIFVKMRQTREQTKLHHIVSFSGEEPQTHPGLLEGPAQKLKPVEHVDTYVCEGGVNLITLLRATRESLIDEANAFGANALVNEQWKCTICEPKNRSDGTYRVQVRYTASATRSQIPDPHRPVALQEAKGVAGLMTILTRND